MFTSHRHVDAGTRPPGRPPLDQAEATLVDQYTRLVRLAYLTLPATLTRHQRVLVAHGLVQRALPRFGGFRADRAPRVPAQRGSDDQSVAAWLRVRVLRAALAHERRPRAWPRRLPPPGALATLLPVVWGLRLFPRAGGAEEIALSGALARVPAAARAAFVLRRLDGLPDSEVLDLLSAAGQAQPEAVLRTSHTLEDTAGPPAETLLRSQEFDACTVQTRPTDLLRRRHRMRFAGALAAVVAIAAVLTTALGADVGGRPAPPPSVGSAEVPDPDDLVRIPRDDWADTSRVDFTAWPARGGRTGDRPLLVRALTTWANPPAGAQVTKSAATTAEPPGGAPQLLYAGDLDGTALVVFHDGHRLVRYGESAGAAPELSFARTDDADVTTAAAIALHRGEGGTRFLLAPWIVESQSRDLLRPDTPGNALGANEDGITDPVRGPSAGGSCDSWPALQLRSSGRIVEKHAFLVTDLGGLSPAHLSYTPLPEDGSRPRQPREATSPTALASWARTACRLTELRDDDVRAVNVWDFAAQELPQDSGRAVWSCTRATTWRGPGHVLIQFKAPAASAREAAPVVAGARSTAACSRFGQHVLATTHWKAPSGEGYLLAAGSREVTSIKASGAVETEVQGPTLAHKARDDASTQVRARLSDGSRLTPVGRD
ncbi:hypothetical protein RCO28_16270 [Streptomyces sp. LHD-70]|uniref:hypothetical protein n=1 Tax=Streptomyces sp. LHD-70 TaxID=3072140 RepID=UPI00280DBA0A|nr:hypothetical protein [Streptomyces sp. LHD-70]MDQ8704035.1 hypothetical protein [Streptomyces sp. LHD-70]